jgi:hypothetical protein
VSHVCADREVHRFIVEPLGRGRASYTSAVLLTGMRGDSLRPAGWTARIQLANAFDELCHELRIQFCAPRCLALAAERPCLGVSQALTFGSLERLFLNQQPLTFVSLSRAAPSQYYRDEWSTDGTAA